MAQKNLESLRRMQSVFCFFKEHATLDVIYVRSATQPYSSSNTNHKLLARLLVLQHRRAKQLVRPGFAGGYSLRWSRYLPGPLSLKERYNHRDHH